MPVPRVPAVCLAWVRVRAAIPVKVPPRSTAEPAAAHQGEYPGHQVLPERGPVPMSNHRWPHALHCGSIQNVRPDGFRILALFCRILALFVAGHRKGLPEEASADRWEWCR
jgi:hypothetical protein